MQCKLPVERRRRHSVSYGEYSSQDKMQLTTTEWMKLMNEKRIRKQAEKNVSQLTKVIELYQVKINDQKNKGMKAEKTNAVLTQKVSTLDKEINEAKGKIVVLSRKLIDLTTELSEAKEINEEVNKYLVPLSRCKPDQIVEMLKEMNTRLVSKLPTSAGLVEKVLIGISKQVVENPDLTSDVLLDMMRSNTDMLSKLNWSHLDDDSKKNLSSGIASMMTSLSQQLLERSDLTSDVLLAMMRSHTDMLSKVNWNYIDGDSKKKLSSGTATMMTSLTQRLLERSDLTSDVMLDMMRSHTDMLSKINWRYIDSDSKTSLKKLSSGTATMMTSLTQRLLERSDLTSDVMLDMMRSHTDMLSKINWRYIDSDSKKNLTSGIATMMTSLNPQLPEHCDGSSDLLRDVIRLSKVIFEKSTWSDFHEDSKVKVISCLEIMMDVLSQRLSGSSKHLLNDVVCIILSLSSADIISRLQSHLETMVNAAGKTLTELSFHEYTVDDILDLIRRLVCQLEIKSISPEVALVLLSLLDSTNRLLIPVGLRERRESFEYIHGLEHEKFQKYLIDKLPSTLPATNDVMIKVLSILEGSPYESASYDIHKFIRRLEPSVADVKHLITQVRDNVTRMNKVLDNLNGKLYVLCESITKK